MKDYILNLDKPRELRFGFKATRTIRQKFGERSLESLLNIKWDEVPVLVWAGLKWDDKQLTVERVEDLLDDVIPKEYTIIEITNITLEALAAHMGIESKKGKADDSKTETKETEAVKPEETTEEKQQPAMVIPSTKKQKKQP